jgi:predicted enzyme related to lactoylglutathione lyase
VSGELTHFELPVVDAEKARDFFSALFGWDPQPRLDGSFYLIDGRPSGGLVSSPDGPGHARLYFSVEDINAAVEHVRRLGGVAGEIQRAEGYGAWSQCRDDQGTEFGLFARARE